MGPGRGALSELCTLDPAGIRQSQSIALVVGPPGAVGFGASQSMTVTTLGWCGRLAADAAGATPTTSRTEAHTAARERFNNVNTNFVRGPGGHRHDPRR